MRHLALMRFCILRDASEQQLEDAVEELLAESETIGGTDFVENVACRAEALAILLHELRRRDKGEGD